MGRGFEIKNGAEMAADRDYESKDQRDRFWIYWISSVITTMLFLFFMTMMLMVPGILPSAKITMLSIAGVAAGVSLGIGVWKFGTTDAPLMAGPLGPVMGVVLLCELAMCAINVVLLVLQAKS